MLKLAHRPFVQENSSLVGVLVAYPRWIAFWHARCQLRHGELWFISFYCFFSSLVSLLLSVQYGSSAEFIIEKLEFDFNPA